MADGIVILQARVELTDPHIVNDNADSLNLLNALFEPLVQRHHQFYQPCLAASWHVSKDARTWNFAIRSGVQFHDGTVMGPEDVVASMKRACAPNVGGILGTEGLFHGYLGDASIEIADQHTVRVITAEPMADLLDLIVSIPILPATHIGCIQDEPIGSGPFRLKSYTDQGVVMTAHTRYWQSGQPPVAAVTWTRDPDPDQRVQRLQRSEVDIITGVSPALAVVIEADERIQLKTAPSNVCTVFMCNLLQGVCTDSRVRQALNYGFDQSELIAQITHGTALPLTGPLTIKHMGFDPALQPYPYDPAKARRLLDEAGQEKGMALVLDVPAELPDEATQVAAFLAQQYTQIGIETDIVTHTDRPAYAQQVKAKAIHDACCFDSSPLSTFRALREKFHGGLQGPWWLGYAHEPLDQTLDQAQTVIDPDARQRLYQSAFRMLHRDAPWIYLYNQVDRWGTSARMGDWQPTVDGLISLV